MAGLLGAASIGFVVRVFVVSFVLLLANRLTSSNFEPMEFAGGIFSTSICYSAIDVGLGAAIRLLTEQWVQDDMVLLLLRGSVSILFGFLILVTVIKVASGRELRDVMLYSFCVFAVLLIMYFCFCLTAIIPALAQNALQAG
ncbi:MAG: hypothetical protein AAF483_00965 [Planctomycetota bacterium]